MLRGRTPPSTYLAHPAGMLHGQATAGHGRSHISLQIHHNSSHRVQASGTIFLTVEKGDNETDGKKEHKQA